MRAQGRVRMEQAEPWCSWTSRVGVGREGQGGGDGQVWVSACEGIGVQAHSRRCIAVRYAAVGRHFL